MWGLLQQQKVYSKKLKSALLTGAIVQCSDNIDVRATSSNSVVWLLTNIVYSEMWFSIFTTKRKMKHVLKVRPLNPCLPLNIHQNSECLILTYAHLFQIGQLWYVTFRRHQLFIFLHRKKKTEVRSSLKHHALIGQYFLWKWLELFLAQCGVSRCRVTSHFRVTDL